MSLEKISSWKSFEGEQRVYSHASQATGTTMEFALYLPPQAATGPVPIVYFLAGLTCTWKNFVEKAGAQKLASELGIAIVCPDTSPRGADVPDHPDQYDLGQGASFYLDATQAPYAQHYQMYKYIRHELPALVEAEFKVQAGVRGIFGHSMGGHGALTLALREGDFYKSVSAFAPIVAPSQVPWGQKAFAAYLGADEALWQQHDACALLAQHGSRLPILIDQGEADQFLKTELKPELLAEVARKKQVDLRLRLHPGYDHSYYFIASFVEDHLRFHAEQLKLT